MCECTVNAAILATDYSTERDARSRLPPAQAWRGTQKLSQHTELLGLAALGLLRGGCELAQLLGKWGIVELKNPVDTGLLVRPNTGDEAARAERTRDNPTKHALGRRNDVGTFHDHGAEQRGANGDTHCRRLVGEKRVGLSS